MVAPDLSNEYVTVRSSALVHRMGSPAAGDGIRSPCRRWAFSKNHCGGEFSSQRVTTITR